ncbi:MAG TPA: phage holin family protein [Jatrophihabitans sp.]|uniref:phage holin family protein n=1 Tax=Jatrophihabitans sp. TaxID=1932789 RepID=UPI002EE2D0F3
MSTSYEGSTSYQAGGQPAGERPSVGELLADISADLSTLMRQEVALAKAELTQSAKQASKGAGMLAGAGVAGHMVLLFISIALWWGIGNETGHGWSALIVAVIWAIIGAVLYSSGRKEMKKVPGVPRTTDTVKKIPSAVAGNEETR